jgi:5-(carboxyamino)imidazole ribonucleotide mutase
MLANERPALRAQLDAFRARQTEAARAMTLPPAGMTVTAAGQRRWA